MSDSEWICGACGYGIYANEAEWRQATHRDANGKPVENDGTLWCPFCKDETLVPLSVASPHLKAETPPRCEVCNDTGLVSFPDMGGTTTQTCARCATRKSAPAPVVTPTPTPEEATAHAYRCCGCGGWDGHCEDCCRPLSEHADVPRSALVDIEERIAYYAKELQRLRTAERTQTEPQDIDELAWTPNRRTLEFALDLVVAEHLHEPTDTEGDIAYDNGVRDCARAIRAALQMRPTEALNKLTSEATSSASHPHALSLAPSPSPTKDKE